MRIEPLTSFTDLFTVDPHFLQFLTKQDLHLKLFAEMRQFTFVLFPHMIAIGHHPLRHNSLELFEGQLVRVEHDLIVMFVDRCVRIRIVSRR